MPTFRLQIKCDNAAFEDLGAEVGRILIDLGQHLDAGMLAQDGGVLFDVNGNRVGSYTLTGGK